MAEDKKIFHIGGKELNNVEAFADNISYYHLSMDEDLIQQLSDLVAIPTQGENNSGNMFLFSFEAMDSLASFDLIRLPSYQIFYEGYVTLTAEQERILRLKGAKKVNLLDGGAEFIEFINQNYAKKYWGTSIDNSMVEISENFDGTVTKKGSADLSLEGDFGDEYQQVVLWKNRWMPTGKIQLHVESTSQGDNVAYFFRAYYVKNGIPEKWDFTKADIEANRVVKDIGVPDHAINISVMAKGQGQIELGDVHLRSDLAPGNFGAMGGKKLIDKKRDEEIFYYFNAGDLKPPLNVYFAGFRPAESYEGRWAMGNMNAPFMLIHDPRLIGGSFYRGEGLEKQIVEAIHDCLDRLGFTTDELILSGLSMGTYAALYYGSILKPHAIVLGKPLANIGGLAINSRIFSPYDWYLALDTIVSLTGELSEASAKELDDGFWEQFLAADFSKTTFIMAHMLQDTDRPFERIFNHLKENYPKTKVLHKGLEGRHNDDTPGIVAWFFKQYRIILQNDFNRIFYQDDDQDAALFDPLEVTDD